MAHSISEHATEPSLRRLQGEYSASFYDKILPPINNPGIYDPRSSRRQKTAAPVKAALPRESEAPLPTRVEPAASAGGPQEFSPRPPPGSDQNVHSRGSSPVSEDFSRKTSETDVTSAELPPLQDKSALDQDDLMEPLSGDLAGSFDLVAPAEGNHHAFSLEERSELLFSRAHLSKVFSNPSSLLRFTAFLSTHRPQSVPLLIYYLDILKALRAIKYANAIVGTLEPIVNQPFTEDRCQTTHNQALEEKAAKAFQALTDQDLPAYVTQLYIQIVSLSISRRITGALAPHLREASEGLAEVFCLTDPSRPDNPIVFASEEFNRTTQYGLSYVLGRNCRFLQGPKTNRLSVQRIRDAVRAGRDHCEVFLNYRRDGSPFMNLLMVAPLRDSKGKTRYFIGAQVDVSGLVKDCIDLESLQSLVKPPEREDDKGKDDFQELAEMLNMSELETVRKNGGRMHREYQEEDLDNTQSKAPHMPRLLLQEPHQGHDDGVQARGQSGKLSGIYQNYLLIRPYPSFRILFASPTLRVPGILQSPFMDKIGGSSRVRDELSAALAEGRGVTAKIRWISRFDEDGRNRWIHCTPLIGSNGQIGVWMIVLVDEDEEISRRWKQAPPVAGPHRGKVYPGDRARGASSKTSLEAASPSQTYPSDRQVERLRGPRSSSPNSVQL